jgi:ABC-type nitrate/sulfonate/bicarbonate transport system substrate-binding protein
MKHKFLFSLCSIALIIIAYAALASAAQISPIRVGYIPIGTPNASAPLEIGAEIANMLGIDAKLIPFNSGPEINKAFTSGNVDIAMMGEAPFLSLIASAPGKFICINTGNRSYFLLGLIVRQESPYRDISDLKGKKLAVPIGSVTHLWILNLLRTYRMTEKDIELANMVVKDAMPALKAKQIDAFAWVTLVGEQAKKEGWGKLINFTGDAKGEGAFADGMFSCANHVVSKEFMDKYPELLQAWEDIYVMTMQFMMEHPVAAGERWAREGGAPLEVYIDGFPDSAPYPYMDYNYYGMLEYMASFLRKTTLQSLPENLFPFTDNKPAAISQNKGIMFKFPPPMYKKRGYLPGIKYNWDERNVPLQTLLKPYVEELRNKHVGEIR